MRVLLNWFISALAIMVVAFLLPGVYVEGIFAALTAAIILGLINAFLRPILILLTLPITIVSLGLFAFVINALLIMLTSAIVPGFVVDGFLWALLFSLILSLVNYAIGAQHIGAFHHPQPPWMHQEMFGFGRHRRSRVHVTHVEQEDSEHE